MVTREQVILVFSCIASVILLVLGFYSLLVSVNKLTFDIITIILSFILSILAIIQYIVGLPFIKFTTEKDWIVEKNGQYGDSYKIIIKKASHKKSPSMVTIYCKNSDNSWNLAITNYCINDKSGEVIIDGLSKSLLNSKIVIA